MTPSAAHPPVDPAVVSSGVAAVRARMAAAGGVDVRLVAVTKGFGPDAVAAAVAAGADACGESYAQEVLAKAEAGVVRARHDPPAARPVFQREGAPPVVHFIGAVQRRKVRVLAPYVSVWQSVDRRELGEEIARRAPGAKVLVQLNLAGAEHRAGTTFDDAPALVAALGELGLDVLGFMGVAPVGPPEAARPGFVRLVSLAHELGLRECSIGMSSDLEVAIEAGSTMVRVGSDIFGSRTVREHGGVDADGRAT